MNGVDWISKAGVSSTTVFPESLHAPIDNDNTATQAVRMGSLQNWRERNRAVARVNSEVARIPV
jgi:hypothetical protein